MASVFIYSITFVRMIFYYKLNSNNLSIEWIEKIRQSFPDKEIEIRVMEADATEYLNSNNSNEKHLTKAINRVEKLKGIILVDPTNLHH